MKRHCADGDDGPNAHTKTFYCVRGGGLARAAHVVGYLGWLTMLFLMLGSTADAFFSPALEQLAKARRDRARARERRGRARLVLSLRPSASARGSLSRAVTARAARRPVPPPPLAQDVGLPPRFAGVTLLALGNGAPDVSATMARSAATRALAEPLTGAGMFVGTVAGVVVIADGARVRPCAT